MTSQKKTTETTLTQLTKRFVKLLNSSSERVINLNEASSKLSVAKRRIYDITNVLEGIGLLQKTSKNVTRWIDCPPDSPLAAPLNNNATTNNNTANNISLTTTTINSTSNLIPTSAADFTTSNIFNSNTHQLHHQQQHYQNGHHQKGHSQNNGVVKTEPQGNQTNRHHHQQQQHLNGTDNGLPDAELLSLLKTYQALEEDINDLQAQIRQTTQTDSAYVTYQDIKSYFLDEIVIAVKAPPNTVLEVDENLLIRLKSEGEEIEVYLCPQYNNDNNNSSNDTNSNTTLAQPAPPQPLPQPQSAQQHQQSHQQQQQQQATQLQPATTQPHPSQSQSYGLNYDTTSGISTDDHYYTNNDPTLSSALSSGEEEDPYSNIPIVPAEGPQYNFMLEDNYTLDSLFPDDDHGIF